MDSARRKALKNAYKEKPVIGGVVCIRCSGNGRVCLQPSVDIEGLRNRYNFAVSIGSSPDPTLRGEWEKYGVESFSFTVLDQIKKGETQSQKEFADDVHALYEIWQEKAQAGEL